MVDGLYIQNAVHEEVDDSENDKKEIESSEMKDVI